MMILVDTSVWIDFFNGISSPSRLYLRKLLQLEKELCISHFVLMELLQGFKKDREFRLAKRHLLEFPMLGLSDPESYIKAAELYRACRKNGVTIRKSIDCLIAQTAIENQAALLHRDKDFEHIASVSNLQIIDPEN